MQWPSASHALSREGGLQRETDGAEGERHARWWMRVARKAKYRRGVRQGAEVIARCDHQGLPHRLVLDQPEHADQGDVVVAEIVTARCLVVVISTIDRVCVRDRWMRR